jgi:hypothetical protein
MGIRTIILGIALLGAAAASYFGMLAPYEGPLRTMAGPSYFFIQISAALLGLLSLLGSFFDSKN